MAEAAPYSPPIACADLALLLAAPFAALARQAQAEWAGSPLHRLSLNGPKVKGFAVSPRDPRDVDPALGEMVLQNRLQLCGETLVLGGMADPWSRPSPSLAFAIALHQFDWLGDVMAAGEKGVAAALRLTMDWRAAFGGWNRFSWSDPILQRRVVNLAIAGGRLTATGGGGVLAASLARQARRLLQTAARPRAAEHLAAAALAGAAIAGFPGERLMKTALARLPTALDRTVLADGAHASRSPEAGMALLFDLLSLDDALVQRGAPAPEALPRAIDRLTGALRVFRMPDGALARFQGGEASTSRRVSAAGAHDDHDATPASQAPHGGYQRLEGGGVCVVVDVGPPARGGWSLAACAQPVAIEVVCGRERVITNAGWSPRRPDLPGKRLAASGSTAALGAGDVGAPLTGLLAFAYGSRLVGAVKAVEVARRETEAGVWLETRHDGWNATAGMIHERRLHLDKQTGELRGEDRFIPTGEALGDPIAAAIGFLLASEVSVSLARDSRSVLLKTASGDGWWLRNDAAEVALERSAVFVDGQRIGSTRVVLHGQVNVDAGGRVRWKLTRSE